MLPMNEEIQHTLPENPTRSTQGEAGEVRLAECERAREANPENLNPRNYAFMPPCYTAQIRPAGKEIRKSTQIKEVFYSY